MLPIYHRWAKVPPDLVTRTSLRRQRLALPASASPVAAFESSWGAYDLFLKSEALPVPYKRAPRDYSRLFAQQYPDKRSAYLAGCEALYQLNRFCKHEECRYSQRHEIYRLKDRWTKVLWDAGLCVGALEVKSPLRHLECWTCDGAGILNGGDSCPDCSDGIYRTVGGKPYWFLHFQVEGKDFSWHQPAHLAPWATTVGQEEPHEVVIKEKSVRLARRRFAEAKALLLWILGPEPEPEPVFIAMPSQSVRDYWTREWQPVTAGDTLDPEEIPF